MDDAREKKLNDAGFEVTTPEEFLDTPAPEYVPGSEETEEPLSAMQASVLARYMGKRTFEHVRRNWYKHNSPKALKSKRGKRQQTKKAKRRNRVKK